MTLRRAPVRTHYYINDTELEHVPEMRDVGVILDTKLTFAAHISHIVSRANRSLGPDDPFLPNGIETLQI